MKGFFGNSVRHGLHAKGIKTGRKGLFPSERALNEDWNTAKKYEPSYKDKKVYVKNALEQPEINRSDRKLLRKWSSK